MEWRELRTEESADWAAEQQAHFELPPTLVFAPVEEQAYAARRLLEQRGLGGEALAWSGTVRIASSFGAADSEWPMALDYVNAMERGLEFTAPPPGGEPSKSVSRMLMTEVAGLPSIGPGGRVTAFDFPSSHYVDVTVRPLVSYLPGGRWRNPEQVRTAVTAMVGAAREYRLRAAFGYSEPSAYEVADVVRPAFVFVLDGPAEGEGPRWRVAIAVPATVGGGDDPPDAENGGLDSDWCV